MSINSMWTKQNAPQERNRIAVATDENDVGNYSIVFDSSKKITKTTEEHYKI